MECGGRVGGAPGKGRGSRVAGGGSGADEGGRSHPRSSVGRPRRGGDEGVEQGLKVVVSGVARRYHDGVPAGEPGGAL